MKLLLILHGLCGLAVCALPYHIFFWVMNSYKTTNIVMLGYISKIVRILLLLYILQIAIAVLIYPKYRVFVRGSLHQQTQSMVEKMDTSSNRIYFDRDFKVGTFLFELKEHCGAIVLVLIIYIFIYLQECIKNKVEVRLTIFLFLILLILTTTFNAVVGLYLTSVKSI